MSLQNRDSNLQDGLRAGLLAGIGWGIVTVLLSLMGGQLNLPAFLAEVVLGAAVGATLGSMNVLLYQVDAIKTGFWTGMALYIPLALVGFATGNWWGTSLLGGPILAKTGLIGLFCGPGLHAGFLALLACHIEKRKRGQWSEF
jgi:hypothetical protein